MRWLCRPTSVWSFLDRACGGDPELRREVESLLSYQGEAETYLEKPRFQAVAQVLAGDGAGLLVNRMLGRYHLLSLIGRGEWAKSTARSTAG
jgi:serine/threonine-protein kinase